MHSVEQWLVRISEVFRISFMFDGYCRRHQVTQRRCSRAAYMVMCRELLPQTTVGEWHVELWAMGVQQFMWSAKKKGGLLIMLKIETILYVRSVGIHVF